MKATIQKISQKHIAQVSLIHYQYLKEGIIANLGIGFLKEFYKKSLLQKNIFTFVALKDKTVVGFATGALDLNVMPRLMLKNLWKETLLAIFQNPLLFSRIIQTPFYPSFRKAQNIGEIFTIAIIPQYRGQGIGSKLISSLKGEFKKRHCQYFQVSVRKRMKEANRFYRKLGLTQKRKAKFLDQEVIFYEGSIDR